MQSRGHGGPVNGFVATETQRTSWNEKGRKRGGKRETREKTGFVTARTFINAALTRAFTRRRCVSTHFIPAAGVVDSGFPRLPAISPVVVLSRPRFLLPRSTIPRVPAGDGESSCGPGRSSGRGGNKKQSSQRGVDRRWHPGTAPFIPLAITWPPRLAKGGQADF